MPKVKVCKLIPRTVFLSSPTSDARHSFICACLCVFVYVYVCVCVRPKERDRVISRRSQSTIRLGFPCSVYEIG